MKKMLAMLLAVLTLCFGAACDRGSVPKWTTLPSRLR